MRRVIKWIFLLVPILLWLSLAGSCMYKQHRTDKLMKEADRAQHHFTGDTSG